MHGETVFYRELAFRDLRKLTRTRQVTSIHDITRPSIYSETSRYELKIR